MKYLFILYLIFYTLFATAQIVNKSEIKFKKNKLYFFCRGTSTKAGITTQKFNISNIPATHTGIGFYEKGKTKIYNVSDTKNDTNNFLFIDSLESFSGVKNVFYLAVWEYNLSYLYFEKLKKLLAVYDTKKVVFDKDFSISFDDTLYCSEFCAMIIKKLGVPGLLFSPVTYDLENAGLLKAYLGRTSLSYYPVDFFTINKRVKKVFEIHDLSNPDKL